MKNIKVSVVVPIYNVELYLDECIKSIVNQTYSNLEIILVDDGSPDNCPSICDSWGKKDKRIKVIHKENAGLGMARNTGIDNSTGDYICFVDSDDVIDLNTIEICCNKIFEYNYDIIHFGYKKIDLDGNIFKNYPIMNLSSKYIGINKINKLLPLLFVNMPNEDKTNFSLSACMCLINMKLVRKINWRFVSERVVISEDAYSLLNLYKHVRSCYILSNDFYSYRLNPKSLTTTYRQNRFECIKKLHKDLVCLYPDNFDMRKRFDYLFLSYSIVCIKSIVGSNNSYFFKLKEIKKIINDDMLNKYIKIYFKEESFVRKIYFLLIRFRFLNLIYLLTFFQNNK